MLIDLQLRLSPVTLRAVTAWFLPGMEPARWLGELARCRLADTETRLFIVAKSVSERGVAGLLVIPPRHREPSQQPRGLACGVIAERLFLPADAAISPPLTEQEVRELCHFPVLFFHPTLGLTGFEKESGLRVCDLIDAPLARAENWNLAKAAQTQPARFRGIILAQPPTIEQVFGEESEEIGSEAGDPLPPAPDEPKEDLWSKARRGARKLFARNIGDLLRQLPHRGRRTWLNDVEDWANRQLSGVSSQLDRLRNKELHRLLHLLDADPEVGLRHAIPLNDFAPRGRAPSGASLGERNIQFDPSRLGGGPADYWNISKDLQMQLTRRYRAMADRELQLGRHRRAAYIYAELLGDLASAASALKQGRHFREAALLYEERLKNPLAAAQCLAEGGLLREAVERYEKHGRWLEAADLYERLGDHAATETALRRVVKQRLAAGDLVGAAQLLETRLKAVDEALTLLEEAWPRSRQALQCLAAQFVLLGCIGRVDAALERLLKLRRENLSGSYLEPLTGMLTDVATNFPDQRVRHRAADLARVMIARQIAEHSLPDYKASGLMRHLYRLDPNDRLLVRDGNRHLAIRRARDLEVRRTVPVPVQPHGLEPKVLKAFELPRQMDWLCVRSDGPWFFAVGVTAKHLTLLRGTWDGEFQSLTWNCPSTSVKQGLICEPVNRPGNRQVIISVAAQDGLKEKLFPPDLFISRSCTAGTPAWLSRDLYPFTIADTNLWSMHMAAGNAVLSCYGLGGGLLRTLDITTDLITDAARTGRSHLCLGHIGHGAIIALGNRMLVPRGDGSMERVELTGDARALVSTLPHTRTGVAVLLDRGVVMHWFGHENPITLENDTEWISGAWTPSGKLILVSATEVCVLDVDTRGVHGIKRFPWHGRTPIAVTAAGEPNQFAIFSVGGRVAVFTAPDK